MQSWQAQTRQTQPSGVKCMILEFEQCVSWAHVTDLCVLFPDSHCSMRLHLCLSSLFCLSQPVQLFFFFPFLSQPASVTIFLILLLRILLISSPVCNSVSSCRQFDLQSHPESQLFEFPWWSVTRTQAPSAEPQVHPGQSCRFHMQQLKKKKDLAEAGTWCIKINKIIIFKIIRIKKVIKIPWQMLLLPFLL